MVALTMVEAILLSGAAANGQARDEVTHPPYALSELHAKGIPPLLAGIESRQAWEAKREAIRRVWLDYIGGLPDRVPVRYEILEEHELSDHIRQRIVYPTVDGDKVFAYLLIPREALAGGRRYPAVLALHPTHADGKDVVATAQGRKNRMYGYELVSRGYIVLAPDAMTAGDRVFKGYEAFRSEPFYKQHPTWSTVGKNIIDHMQGVDLLVQHELVDPNRIGAIGHSFGGYNAYFLASLDERVRVVVSSCGFCPFTGNPDPGHWGIRDWYTHLPRISDDLAQDRVPFEFHEIVALSAPRPMFFYSAQSDHIFPHWESIAQAMLDLHRLYAWLGVEERFVSVIGTGDHDFPEPIRKMAYDFLDRWLRPPTTEP